MFSIRVFVWLVRQSCPIILYGFEVFWKAKLATMCRSGRFHAHPSTFWHTHNEFLSLLGKVFSLLCYFIRFTHFHPAAMNSCQSDCQAGDNQDRDEYCFSFFSAVHGGYINYIIY